MAVAEWQSVGSPSLTSAPHGLAAGRADVVKRYTTQLKRESPGHEAVQGLDTVSAAFDRVAAGFAAES